MAAFTTSYNKTFDVVSDELNQKSVKVLEATTQNPICILRNVDWWDKDGISKALEEHKDFILKKIEERCISTVTHKQKTPLQALEEVVNHLAKSMGSDNEDFQYCAEHIGLAISKLNSIA